MTKTEGKHTPGPLGPEDIGYVIDGEYITVRIRRDSPHFLLLTAAPELLEAAKQACLVLQEVMGRHATSANVWGAEADLRAALAKAQGE